MLKFSIVVPVYNVEAYLDECLRSLQGQGMADFEVLCVNDGSTDGSRALLAEWEKRFPQMRIIDRENGGLSAARNTGLDAAHGEYVLFADSDDWVETNALEILDTNLRLPTSDLRPLDMVCFACRRTDNDAADALPSEEACGWDYYNRHALEHREVPFVCVWQRCYRRQFLLDNALRFHEGILHEDNEFTPRACLAAKRMKVIPDVLYHYRVRPGSIMTTRGLRSKESLILIANDLTKHFSAIDGIDKTTIYRALTQCYQMAFVDNNREEDRNLQTLVDWKAYRQVSRTKPRHRINYDAIRIAPLVFRTLNQHL